MGLLVALGAAIPAACATTPPSWVARGQDDRYPPPRYRVATGSAPIQDDAGAALEAAEDRARAALSREIRSEVDARSETRIRELRRYGADPETDGLEALDERIRTRSRAEMWGVRKAEHHVDREAGRAHVLVVLDLAELERSAHADLAPQRTLAAELDRLARAHDPGAALVELLRHLRQWPPLPPRVRFFAEVAPERAHPLLRGLPDRARAHELVRRLAQRVRLDIHAPPSAPRAEGFAVHVTHDAPGLPVRWSVRPALSGIEAPPRLPEGGTARISIRRAFGDRDGLLTVAAHLDAIEDRRNGEPPRLGRAEVRVPGPPPRIAVTASTEGCRWRAAKVVGAVQACGAGDAVRWHTDAAGTAYDQRTELELACRRGEATGTGGYSYTRIQGEARLTRTYAPAAQERTESFGFRGTGRDPARAQAAAWEQFTAELCRRLP